MNVLDEFGKMTTAEQVAVLWTCCDEMRVAVADRLLEVAPDRRWMAEVIRQGCPRSIEHGQANHQAV